MRGFISKEEEEFLLKDSLSPSDFAKMQELVKKPLA
jgi:hypothetical protein